MTFLKLDTGVIRNFDHRTLGDVHIVRTGFLASLRGLAGSRGWGPALGLALRAFLSPREDMQALVAGNVARKAIRLPALFGNRFTAGFYRWIKGAEAAILHPYLADVIAARKPDTIIVYNGSNYPESVLADVSEGRRRIFVEGGFFPETLQLDPIGLNAANSVPRAPEFYLETTEDFAAEGLPEVVNNRPSKGRFAPIALERGYVFVPFQVPSDMQVTLHSPWIRDMEMFQDAICDLAEACPEETFVIKEHPSFKRSVIGRRSHPRVIYANGNVTSELIAGSRAVVTLNSTVGIEALLLGRPVITLGEACYNVEGLVLRAGSKEALVTAISQSKTWKPDERLRRQFLGYLWNRYLLHGSYGAPPADLAAQIELRTAAEAEQDEPAKEIQIAISSDAKMVDPALVLIGSICENASRRVKLHFLGYRLDATNRSKINVFCESWGCQLVYHDLPDTLFEEAIRANENIPLMALARLYLPQWVQGRVLYLDCDMLALGDVAEIYDADMRGADLGVVRDFYVLDQMKDGAERPEKLAYHRDVLKRDDVAGYFNSGLLLFDCDRIRRNAALCRAMTQLQSANGYRFMDQDHLNVLFDGRTTFLPLAWNSIWGQDRKRFATVARLPWLNSVEIAPKASRLIHFTGPKKPWSKQSLLFALFRGRLPALVKWRRAARKYLS